MPWTYCCYAAILTMQPIYSPSPPSSPENKTSKSKNTVMLTETKNTNSKSRGKKHKGVSIHHRCKRQTSCMPRSPASFHTLNKFAPLNAS